MLPTPRQPGPRLVCVVGVLPAAAAAEIGATQAIAVTERLAALESSDAFIACVDGDQGIDNQIVESWQRATDVGIPSLLLVTNCVAGRADFSEMLAIANRALHTDIAARFVPLADDDGAHVAALLDLLRLAIVRRDGTRTPAEPEHISATQGEREAVINLLAHTAIDDDLVALLSAGMSPAVSSLERLWVDTSLPRALVADESWCVLELRSWLHHLGPRWQPVVDCDGTRIDIADCTDPVGIAVADGLVRIWHAAKPCELVSKGGLRAVLQGSEVTIEVAGATAHDSFVLAGSPCRVLEPTF